MTNDDIVFDYERRDRIGIAEAVFCAGKSVEQIASILTDADAAAASLLLTRLDTAAFAALPAPLRARMDYHALSGTAFLGALQPVWSRDAVAIVAAGTSDTPVACEARRTLRHAGVEAGFIVDVGVAGLWRLTDRLDDIRGYRIVIAVAGMDAALASVLGGLVSGPLVCVPTSVGYGAAEGGRTALGAMLSSCAPGLTVCNIDNGYGAACAAIRMLSLLPRG